MRTFAEHDFTILIPSFERHQSLKSTIEYFSNHGLHTTVVDGSSECLEKKWAIPKNCNYLWLPDTDQVRAMGNYADRIRFAADKINSKYILYCNDDERRFPSGIEAAIEKLDQDLNQEFVACSAPVVQMSLFGKNCFLSAGYTKIPELSKSLYSDETSMRLNELSMNYQPVAHFSVMRTVAWKKAVEVAFAYEPRVFAFAELIIEVSLASFGRYLYSEIPIALRSDIERKIPRKKKIVRIWEWWETLEGVRVLKNIERLIHANIPCGAEFKSLEEGFLYRWMASFILINNSEKRNPHKLNFFYRVCYLFWRVVRGLYSKLMKSTFSRKVKCSAGALLFLQCNYTSIFLLDSKELCGVVDSYVSMK